MSVCKWFNAMKNNKKALILGVCLLTLIPQGLFSSSRSGPIGCLKCNGNPATYCGRSGMAQEATECLTSCSKLSTLVSKAATKSCLEHMSKITNWYQNDREVLENWHAALGEDGRARFSEENLQKLDGIIHNLENNTVKPVVQNPPVVVSDPSHPVRPLPKPPIGSPSISPPKDQSNSNASGGSSSASSGEKKDQPKPSENVKDPSSGVKHDRGQGQASSSSSKPSDVGQVDTFSADGYLYAHKDLLAALSSTAPDVRRKFALDHYEGHGKGESRTFEQLPENFTPEEYLAINDDLAKVAPEDPKERFIFAINHFLHRASIEGRQYHKLPQGFTAEGYLTLHPDVATHAPQDRSRRVEFAMWHYLHHGVNEGRAHGSVPPPPPGSPPPPPGSPPPVLRPGVQGGGDFLADLGNAKDRLKKRDPSQNDAQSSNSASDGNDLASILKSAMDRRRQEQGDDDDSDDDSDSDDDW
jgi:hypothetical protein